MCSVAVGEGPRASASGSRRWGKQHLVADWEGTGSLLRRASPDEGKHDLPRILRATARSRQCPEGSPYLIWPVPGADLQASACKESSARPVASPAAWPRETRCTSPSPPGPGLGQDCVARREAPLPVLPLHGRAHASPPAAARNRGLFRPGVEGKAPGRTPALGRLQLTPATGCLE